MLFGETDTGSSWKHFLQKNAIMLASIVDR